MSQIVYLLGAGANQVISDWNGLKPPLNNNFFKMALQSQKYGEAHYLNKITPVYDYISRYWKKSIDDLKNTYFNLEDCFTMLQFQRNDAERAEEHDEYVKLTRIEFLLESFLAEYLSEFEISSVLSDSMRDFGRLIYREQPTVITFNYDCILESAIESASGVNTYIPQSFQGGSFEQEEVLDDELPYSHCNWNRPLAYGINFDEIQLQRAGLSTYVDGNRFYSHHENRLYSWTILKLHGSLNWFQYLPIRKYPSFGLSEEKLPEEKLGEVLLINGHWWFSDPPDFQGWLLNPLIITPVLHKEQSYRHPLFSKIWRQAHKELSTCKRLVVVGYSFSVTDFSIRKLLLEALCETSLEELIVVNPDTSIVQIIKELSHFNKPVLVCRDLEEYLRLYNT